ncbi:MAG: helix-turn-helix transcriptional regulator [Alphaproteobacteria bacterium]|nr:helix-turn-helix transcriptional regulator [Alphaproteobacteria bacterium]MDE2493265.1 helix-turn-helix transcriptional regulator [Alphaproteobacteria bacterium]
MPDALEQPTASAPAKGGRQSREATRIDMHVGSRLRLRRMTLGMPQERLAQALGVSFQQVQKYEKGANRISAGRLYMVAQILGTNVSYFFSGADETPKLLQSQAADDAGCLQSLLRSREGVQLATAFMAIRNQRIRKRILDLIAALQTDAHL